MARLATALVLAIALAAVPVHGGNRAWEPSIMHTDHIKAVNDPALFVGENATAIGGSASAGNNLRKRYITIKPGPGNADAKLWPDRTITYCFESDETKTAVFEALKEAKQLWTDAGLSEAFKWKLGEDDFCGDPANRSKFLLITYNTEGRLGTTVGLPPIEEGVNAGPTMQLSDSLEVGMLSVVPNYAHEMGHAWGMHHEHQNQRFWDENHSEAAGEFFGDNNWNCQNLKDYADVRAKLLQDWGPGEGEAKMKQACRNRRAAINLDFSAHDYLPIVDEQVLASTKKEPDWESIMIYPSGAGGVGSATNGNDQRSPILLKPDGSRIPINLKPSQRDVKGLTDLYGGALAAKWTLLGEKASTYKNKFTEIRKKAPDSGCS